MILLVILLPILMLSQPSAASECSATSGPYGLIKAALEKSPSVQRAEKSLEQTSEQEGKAGQIPNPEFESKGVKGKSLGDEIIGLEFSLTQPIELGGKRGYRIDVALAEKRKTEAELLGAKEESFIHAVITLNRLRQMQVELEILREALTTFSKITSQFRSRPKLGPDQQVSFGIIQIALGDYKLRKSRFESEEFETRKRIEIAFGCELPSDPEKTKTLLPASTENWPSIESSKAPLEFKNALSFSVLAEIDHARSEYDLAKAESWPDLSVGPVIQHQSEGGIAYQTYGLSLSFPLPLFSLNGGGRAYAAKGLLLAEHNLKLVQIENKVEFEILKNKYLSAVTSLKDALTLSELEGKHRNIERLFAQGLVGGATVVEAHRQIVDFSNSKHELELIALESLLKIRALEGKLFEEKL